MLQLQEDTRLHRIRAFHDTRVMESRQHYIIEDGSLL